MKIRSVIMSAILVLAYSASAEIRMPKIFSSHMVLQQDSPITVWGWSAAKDEITVKIASSQQKARSNDKGEWKVVLSAMKSGGPFIMTVTGSGASLNFEDILVGEVWICSGQSNMAMGVGLCNNAEQEIQDAKYPDIRLFIVPVKMSTSPQADMDAGSWNVCSPQTLAQGGWGGFSGSAYYFGRELHKKLKVPVGLIESAVGGTRIEPWTPPEGFGLVPSLEKTYQKVMAGDPRTSQHKQLLSLTLKKTQEWIESAGKALKEESVVPPMPAYPQELLPPDKIESPTALYNAMINPLVPFAIRGAVWYQGEANHNEGMEYAEKMKALVGGWRKVWNIGDFPFYFAQIAPFGYGPEDPAVLAEFWEAQSSVTAAVQNTGMAVTNDIGDMNDIHPKNKQEVGRRLALLALANTYGQKNTAGCGPTYKSMMTEGNKLRVTFSNVGGGLASRDGQPLSCFELIDADKGGFVPAEAVIDGGSVVLSATGVGKPVAMRFAWSKSASPNLMNKEGLPSSTFRAGNVPVHDSMLSNVPEAKDYQLIYDLDLAKSNGLIRYDVDNHVKFSRSFDRIAYCLELQAGGDQQYAYVSMDAFTDDIGKIGIPTVESKAKFQQAVEKMNVSSNVQGVATGTGLKGNIEFWPNNYVPKNARPVPNASDAIFDFGDEIADPELGYGSMQIHNYDAKQTVFAFNHWLAGPKADLGIGNAPSGNPDWTFAANGESFKVKRLRVLVHFKQ